MSVLNVPSKQVLTGVNTAEPTMPFVAQVVMLTRRSLVTTFRDATWVLPIVLGVFFLLIYEGSLNGAARIFLPGQSYLGFILPLSVISTALSGAGTAGQIIVNDINSGYFDKLLLTPISRAALVLGPMIAAALALIVYITPLIVVAVLMGLRPVTGLPGILALMGLSLLIGMGLAGFIVGVALRTGSASATNSAGFMVFPLTFLTATFTPLELLTGWIRTAAELNPITYLLEASRALLNTGWDFSALAVAVAVLTGLIAVTFKFAFYSLRARTRRR